MWAYVVEVHNVTAETRDLPRGGEEREDVVRPIRPLIQVPVSPNIQHLV